jgi:cytochrome c
MKKTIVGTALLSLAAFPAVGEDAGIVRGRVFAKTNCGSCHATGRVGESPLAIAPAFRDLHKRYDVEDLRESLAEGIMTSHPSMPQFQLHLDEIDDLIGYMKSLEPKT